MKVYLVTVRYSLESYDEIAGIYYVIEKAQERAKELDKFYNKDYYERIDRVVSEYEKMFGKENALKRAEQDVRIESKDYEVDIQELEIDKKILTTSEELEIKRSELFKK